MRIKQLYATFGALDSETLVPGDGLTVITAPNESGKTTWAAFWRAMLYGIDTKERDRAGFLADKNRWQPWSGAPMAGELRAEWQGEDLTVRRFATRSGPFGGFEAVYTDSGDPVPGLTAKNLGESLTGAGREVYTRSAFVGQGGAAIGQNSELEARVSALATAGQEDTSYSTAERVLRDWRNRRRANKATGLIPELQGKLEQAEDTLRRMERLEVHQDAALGRLEELELERVSLNADLEAWDRLDRQELDRRYGEAADAAERARADLEILKPPEPDLAGWTAKEAYDWARDRERDYEETCRQREEILARRIEAGQDGNRPAAVALILALVIAVGGLVVAFLNGMHVISVGFPFYIGVVLGAVVCLSARKSIQKKARRTAEELELPDPPDYEGWERRAQSHAAYLARRECLESELRHQRQRAEDLAAQGAVSPGDRPMPERPALSREETAARLRSVEQSLARNRDELARAQGALAQLGDPLELEARRDGLEDLIRERTAEYDALTAALEVLDQANSALRQRFSPALNQEAGNIFSALTDGRWPQITLARDFTAQAARGAGELPRPALALSAGTAEQLYLAVRLAICRLTLPEAPIFLDDALCTFDDERLALALEYLTELGQERQILLFSCHRREAEWARAHNVPVLELGQQKSV